MRPVLQLARRALGLLATLAVALFVLAAAALLVPAALGYERYVIVSGSMTGTYDRGSLIFDRRVPVSSLRVGDVITYRPPPGWGTPGRDVTHRIVSAGRAPDGRRAFRTKGDANPVADPWRVTIRGNSQPKVVFAVPYAGYAFAAMGVREVRMLALGVPALLIALVTLARLWRDAGVAARRRDAAALPAGAEGS